jgi:hypothetical protein
VSKVRHDGERGRSMTRRDPRYRGTFGAAALGLVLLAPAGAARAGGSSVLLAGTTVVTGSRSASAPVVLTRSARVRIETPTAQSTNVVIAGRGRVVAIDLRRDDGTAKPAHLFSALTNGCYARGCAPRARFQMTAAYGFAASAVSDGVKEYTLPAGRYRLTFVTDGAPASVRLRLGGLAGTATVRPTGRAPVTFQPLVPNLAAGPQPALVAYSAAAGALPLGDRGGVLFTVFDVRLSAGDVGQRGFCYYPGTTTERTYVATCPGAQSSSGEGVTGLVPEPHGLRGTQIVEGAHAAVPGSTGLYYDSVGIVESFDALSVRLGY